MNSAAERAQDVLAALFLEGILTIAEYEAAKTRLQVYSEPGMLTERVSREIENRDPIPKSQVQEAG